MDCQDPSIYNILNKEKREKLINKYEKVHTSPITVYILHDELVDMLYIYVSFNTDDTAIRTDLFAVTTKILCDDRHNVVMKIISDSIKITTHDEGGGDQLKYSIPVIQHDSNVSCVDEIKTTLHGKILSDFVPYEQNVECYMYSALRILNWNYDDMNSADKLALLELSKPYTVECYIEFENYSDCIQKVTTNDIRFAYNPDDMGDIVLQKDVFLCFVKPMSRIRVDFRMELVKNNSDHFIMVHFNKMRTYISDNITYGECMNPAHIETKEYVDNIDMSDIYSAQEKLLHDDIDVDLTDEMMDKLHLIYRRFISDKTFTDNMIPGDITSKVPSVVVASCQDCTSRYSYRNFSGAYDSVFCANVTLLDAQIKALLLKLSLFPHDIELILSDSIYHKFKEYVPRISNITKCKIFLD